MRSRLREPWRTAALVSMLGVVGQLLGPSPVRATAYLEPQTVSSTTDSSLTSGAVENTAERTDDTQVFYDATTDSKTVVVSGAPFCYESPSGSASGN